MFFHRQRVGRVEFAFTDRRGGVSNGPWDSLNLGTSNGDDLQKVGRNLAEVSTAFGVDRMVRMTQVHATTVAWAEDVWTGSVAPGDLDRVPIADALLVSEPGLAVLVRVADCVPIVLVGADGPIAGVIHCGRAGLVAGVVEATVETIRARHDGSLQAWVGPRACGQCYELPADLADDIERQVPGTRTTTSWGTPAVDVGAGAIGQLESLGVEVTDLGSETCTIEDEQWFSYRRQGQDSGRFGAVAVIR